MIFNSLANKSNIQNRKEKLRRYTPDFKENVVLLIYDRKNVIDTSLEFDISPKLLSKWRAVYRTFRNGSFPGRGRKRIYYEDKKIFELEKELSESQLRFLCQGFGW